MDGGTDEMKERSAELAGFGRYMAGSPGEIGERPARLPRPRFPLDFRRRFFLGFRNRDVAYPRDPEGRCGGPIESFQRHPDPVFRGLESSSLMSDPNGKRPGVRCDPHSRA